MKQPSLQKTDIASGMPSEHFEHAKSEALINSIGEGIIATDENGKISRVNAVALTILGFSEEELLGKWFPKIIGAYKQNGEPIALIDRPITKAVLTGKVVNDKTHYMTKNGTLVPVAVSVSPIMFEGRPYGAVEVFRDISLETKIDRMKSEFISLASHQLRTPLSAISSYVHMLDDGYQGELNEGQKAYTHIIIQSIFRMNELINALLNVSKIEAGKMAVNISRIDVVSLTEGIIREQQTSIEKKHLKCKIRLPEAPLIVLADPLLLREIFANLISNAIKYTPHGGRIAIRLTGKEKSYVFTVRDTGYGIPEKYQSSIFTKFFRADNIMDKDTTGSGLGLYMVKELTEMLHGKLHFKSKEDAGSVFLVEMPKVITRRASGQ